MDAEKFREVVEFAIANEREAGGLYDKYRGIVKSAAARQLLLEMAAMERGHEKALTALLKGGKDRLAKASQTVADLRISDYLVEMRLTPDSPIEDVFIYAMKAEEKARQLYEHLAQTQPDPVSQELFLRLAKEEKKHKLDLETQYDNGVLAWN